MSYVIMFNLRWSAVWQRNFRVWRKLFTVSMLGNFFEPLIYLLGLGFGLGGLVGQLDGMPYLIFLTSGMLCSSSMQAATFESLYSVYTRLSWQKTWDGMLATPLDVEDIVLGETLWSATKGLINGTAILLVAALLGLVTHFTVLWALPIMFLLSCCFAAMGLIVTAYAKGYDFFTYYMTLFLSPMLFLSGIFFPINRMPVIIQHIAQIFPLYHAVELVRPLFVGRTIERPFLHISIILIYTIVAYVLASGIFRRKMIS